MQLQTKLLTNGIKIIITKTIAITPCKPLNSDFVYKQKRTQWNFAPGYLIETREEIEVSINSKHQFYIDKGTPAGYSLVIFLTRHRVVEWIHYYV